MNDKELMQEWINHFNQADAGASSTIYHAEAINHQVAWNQISRKDQIREMCVTKFSKAEMTCIPQNQFCDGDWIRQDLKDTNKLRAGGLLQIEGSKIQFQRGYCDMLTLPTE